MPILIILVGETPHRNSDPCRPGLLQNDATFSSAFWLQSSPRTSVMFLKDVPWGHKNHQTHPVGLEFSRQRMECLFVSRTCFVRYTTLITKCLFNIKWNLTHRSPTNIWDVNQPKVGLSHSHLGFDQPNWAETCKNDQKCGLNKATCFFQWQAWECLMEELTGTRDIASTVTFLEPWCPDPSTNLGLALMKCRSKWFNDFQGIYPATVGMLYHHGWHHPIDKLHHNIVFSSSQDLMGLSLVSGLILQSYGPWTKLSAARNLICTDALTILISRIRLTLTV